MGKKPTPREGSVAAQIIETKNQHPDWTREDIAVHVGGCHLQYITATFRKFKHLLKKIAPPAAEKPVAAKKPAAPEKPLLDEDGVMRGGNGKTDYSIKGVHKHEGPVDGLEGLTMAVTIVQGNDAATVREAKAFISSIIATLAGLDKVEKDLENPDHLNFHAAQVSNILNAASRIRDKMIDVVRIRANERWISDNGEKTYKGRSEWTAETHQVQPDPKKAVPAE